MSLVGGPLLVVVGIALVVVTVGAVMGGPRWGPRWVGVVQRTVLVLSAQVVALVMVGLAVNDWGSFYGSWSDLFGGSTGVVTTAAGGHSAWDESHAGGGAPALQPTHWSDAKQYAQKGELGAVELAGRRSGQRARALIYLPPQYFDAADSSARFPVVEVFPGYPGEVQQLVTRLGFPSALLDGIRAHRLRPMILVMLNPSLVLPRDTECTNVPGGPQVVTFLTQDVPADLHANLRVTSGGWGVMGQSTGGYCAAKLAMMAPHQFVTAVSLSGYYNARHDSTTGDLWGGSTERRDLNDLDWRLAHLPAPAISLLVTIGSLEPGIEGLPGAQQFIGLVRPPMTARLVVVKNGAHNFHDYQSVRGTALAWLSDHLGAAGSQQPAFQAQGRQGDPRPG
ncbi:esterase family protein [Allobranchiibius sp. GilTou73]|uniref:alpha/beta hydrolase n=1 Tax=Allobranchiibius sp. GilTou73 TaxID=2904523 RepID=UPI001F3894BD|nr:alpha/beta hydrolase-fold protein [Allobranchiibius sp. GilTou73]UIJ35875.1 esterase family protein [Allobranchiibius sp. GilTou73]